MTLTEFLQLDYQGRLQAAERGVCVGGRQEGEYMVLLYQLYSFYIEVFYHKQYSYISALHGFDDLDCLEPYLQKIELDLTY